MASFLSEENIFPPLSLQVCPGDPQPTRILTSLGGGEENLLSLFKMSDTTLMFLEQLRPVVSLLVRLGVAKKTFPCLHVTLEE